MIDGPASAARALARVGTQYAQDLCLTFTYESMGSPDTNMPGGSFGSAVEAISRLHAAPSMDLDAAPVGCAWWWGAKYPGDPGHVAVGTGGPHAVSTNAYQTATGRVFEQGRWRNLAEIGHRSIAALSRGRGPLLGWTAEAFNNPITDGQLPTLPAADDLIPLTPDPKDDLMKLIAIGKHLFIVGPEYIRHVATTAQHAAAQQAYGAADEYDEDRGKRLLSVLSIPEPYSDPTRLPKGGWWSRQRAILDQLEQLTKA